MVAGQRVLAGTSYATLLPAMDFETYSEAGYVFDETANKWQPITTSPPHGREGVGASVYSEHPSTEILSLAYDLKDELGARLWVPGMNPPQELFDHFAAGGLMEAWNSSFEWYIWNNVCAARMGWPPLPFELLRDAMAKGRAFSLPGKLKFAAKALGTTQKKEEGTRLLNKFSKPRKPTKKDPRRRIRVEDDPADAAKLFEYNLGDIIAETEVSMRVPDLSSAELDVWLLDQTINFRGAAVDSQAIEACTAVVDQAFKKYTAELYEITGGRVDSISKIKKLSQWLGDRGVHSESLDMAHVGYLLKRQDLAPDIRRVLEIRKILGSSSVKKLYAIANRVSADGRMRDLFAYYGAQRTGRFAGRGAQFQNLPRSGPKTRKCGCGHHSGVNNTVCPWCNRRLYHDMPPVGWSLNVVQDVLAVVATRDLTTVEFYFDDAIPVIVGCLRALFIAPDGYELICSDYSAIEAVILAMISGEQWRIDVFKTHGMIYEASAAMITGVPFEEFVRHRQETGEHHPLRNKIGKYAELASGYGGWVGAWKTFGADEYLSDEEIEDAAGKWRKASPAIADKKTGFWKQVETAAIEAISNPGECFSPSAFPGISYGMKDDVLYCQLPSGRKLTYISPRLSEGIKPWGERYTIITYMGWNSDPQKGPVGWVRLETYGGKLTENIVQALARDIQVFGMANVERAGYPLVLHAHDESVSQVKAGFGSIEEYERLLSTLPPWTLGWPIRAVGGWRGRNYRKA